MIQTIDEFRGVIAGAIGMIGIALWVITDIEKALSLTIVMFWWQIESIRLNIGTMTLKHVNKYVQNDGNGGGSE